MGWKRNTYILLLWHQVSWCPRNCSGCEGLPIDAIVAVSCKKVLPRYTGFWSSSPLILVSVYTTRFQENSLRCKEVILLSISANSGRQLCITLISLQPLEVETMWEENKSLVRDVWWKKWGDQKTVSQEKNEENLGPHFHNNTPTVLYIFSVWVSITLQGQLHQNAMHFF